MAKAGKSKSRSGRKQHHRANLKPQDWTLGLSVVHPKAAGIDVGNEEHYVAVPPVWIQNRCECLKVLQQT